MARKPTTTKRQRTEPTAASIPGEDGEASRPVVSLAVLAPSQPGDFGRRGSKDGIQMGPLQTRF